MSFYIQYYCKFYVHLSLTSPYNIITSTFFQFYLKTLNRSNVYMYFTIHSCYQIINFSMQWHYCSILEITGSFPNACFKKFFYTPCRVTITPFPGVISAKKRSSFSIIDVIQMLSVLTTSFTKLSYLWLTNVTCVNFSIHSWSFSHYHAHINVTQTKMCTRAYCTKIKR